MPTFANLPLSTVALLFRIYCGEVIDTSDADTTKAINDLLVWGLIFSLGNGRFDTTEKGKVYLDAIRKVPMPEQKWIIPT